MQAQIVIKNLLIIQFAIGISLLAATLMGSTVTPLVEDNSIEPQELASETVQIEVPTEEPIQPKTTKELVEDYFSENPIMIQVAKCESGFRQFGDSGQPLRGRVNSADVGVMQINETYHAASAKRLGYNLYTTEGNMGYAQYLYDTQGTRPWVHSSKCWNKVQEVAMVN